MTPTQPPALLSCPRCERHDEVYIHRAADARRGAVGFVECHTCGEATSFYAQALDIKDFGEQGIAAWNRHVATMLATVQPPALHDDLRASYIVELREMLRSKQTDLVTANQRKSIWRGMIRDDIAALEAAIAALAGQADAVLWVDPDALANDRFVGINAVRRTHQDWGKPYTQPLYTHPAPMPVDALREIFDAFSGDVDQVGEPTWVLDDADYKRFAELIAATKEAGNGSRT